LPKVYAFNLALRTIFLQAFAAFPEDRRAMLTLSNDLAHIVAVLLVVAALIFAVIGIDDAAGEGKILVQAVTGVGVR
jgi:hypothetical protein